MMENQNWYEVKNVDEIDSPALLVYKDRVIHNIDTLIKSIDSVERLRPHIKTHKSADVVKLMLSGGITKFKCATIAEAEMLAGAGARDVLLAYQPAGPRAARLVELMMKFPGTKFSCLIDDAATAKKLADAMDRSNMQVDTLIDLNVGMNRTGVVPEHALQLFSDCLEMQGIRLIGLHAYDGHLRDTDYEERKKKCDAAFSRVEELKSEIEAKFGAELVIVAGGTPTYSIHCKRKNIECSPGTFIYWDEGYSSILKEQQYDFAALVLTRVISCPAENIICLDLGHKAIASENPIQSRVFFLNARGLEPIGHSEEHMVFKTNGMPFKVGDVLYGVPYHICPTVALHDRAAVVENGRVTEFWNTTSRTRKITI
jgi:D-serine deaminase-like pyridoxal phosphate-dependent protein